MIAEPPSSAADGYPARVRIHWQSSLPFAMILVAGLMTTGCDKPSDKAKREYQIMLRAGASGEERCAKLQENAAAYLKEENMGEYPLAKVSADIQCNRVAIDRLGR